MDILTRDFVVNADLQTLLFGDPARRTYTWNLESFNDLNLTLHTCLDFEKMGWSVALESPVLGVQRDHRIPVIALRDSTVLVIKPVKDSKKVNSSGLKMLDLKSALEGTFPEYELKSVVYAFMGSFDERRKTSDKYEIWLRG